MSKVIVDSIQRPGGAVISIPATDGTAGQFLKTDGASNLVWSATYAYPAWSTSTSYSENKGLVGSIVTSSARSNIYSTGEWTTTGPWAATTYQQSLAYADNTATQFVNIALGDGLGSSGTTTNAFMGDSEREYSRQVEYSAGNRLGFWRDQNYYDNVTGAYSGITNRIMPVRNTTGAAITITLAAYASSYASAADGANLFVLVPNTAVYSTVNSVTGVNVASIATTIVQGSLTGTYSVPANTTVLVCLGSSHPYQTTYRFKDCNYFYNLNTTFTNPGIICDMRMLQSLYTSRFNLNPAAVMATSLPPLWTKTAVNFGDR